MGTTMSVVVQVFSVPRETPSPIQTGWADRLAIGMNGQRSGTSACPTDRDWYAKRAAEGSSSKGPGGQLVETVATEMTE